jgi:hypothetical protein
MMDASQGDKVKSPIRRTAYALSWSALVRLLR